MDAFPAITAAADKLNRTLRGFAAPGDYGYDTPEGKFLLEMYRCVHDLLNAIDATRADREARAHVEQSPAA